jgi:disintegrin and metalloproteinase domain-containing protein 10
LSAFVVSNERGHSKLHVHNISSDILKPSVSPAIDLTGSTSCSEKCVCTIALLGDLEFFNGPDGNKDITYAMSTMVNRMATVNTIYQTTDFGGQTGFSFLITSVTVFNSTGNGNSVPGSSYTDASTYLEDFSKGGQWSAQCLAHMFTYRDFNDGVLGLAFVGSPTGSGGICDSGNYNTVSKKHDRCLYSFTCIMLR